LRAAGLGEQPPGRRPGAAGRVCAGQLGAVTQVAAGFFKRLDAGIQDCAQLVTFACRVVADTVKLRGVGCGLLGRLLLCGTLPGGELVTLAGGVGTYPVELSYAVILERTAQATLAWPRSTTWPAGSRRD
jgi:hypothetical protein